MKRNLFIEVISASLILLFFYTASNKSTEIYQTADVLIRTKIFSNYAYEISWGIVIVEFILVGLLLIPRTRLFGLYTSLVVLTGFTLYIIFMMAFAPNLPCTCGGVIKKLTWKEHIIFNSGFILLALIGIWLYQKNLKREREIAPSIPT